MRFAGKGNSVRGTNSAPSIVLRVRTSDGTVMRLMNGWGGGVDMEWRHREKLRARVSIMECTMEGIVVRQILRRVFFY